MKQKILFLHCGRMSGLPPFLALLDYLVETNLYEITIISAEIDDEIDAIYIPAGVKIIHYFEEEPRIGILSRIRNRLKRDYIFRFKAPRDAAKIDYDILWIISEKSAILLNKFLRDKKYILSIYELGDKYPTILKKIAPIAQSAKVNIVCEYNRANIMRIWLKLNETPKVLPNKPYIHPQEKFLVSDYSSILKDKKIILYQGHISRDRNLEGICQAISEIETYSLVLMGDGGEYIDYLKNKYPKVIYINYVKAPFHLNITSYARIGIVTYDFYSLNTIYCAPNKIWEYSGFGIPMLANDIPGLRYTVGQYASGLCIDMNNPEEIKDAIEEIEKNYSTYSHNALKMYKSCDITEIINEVILRYNKF